MRGWPLEMRWTREVLPTPESPSTRMRTRSREAIYSIGEETVLEMG